MLPEPATGVSDFVIRHSDFEFCVLCGKIFPLAKNGCAGNKVETRRRIS